MSDKISITQAFLAQLLFETEQDILVNPKYQGTGEVFNVATFLISESFRQLMHSLAAIPQYGVQSEGQEQLREAVKSVRYSDLKPEQQAEINEVGRRMESLLRDPAARIAINGLLQAYRQLEDERNEEVPQNADGDV